MDRNEERALARVLEVASRDTGQSRRAADFLLSWWNAQSCGKWDPTDLWGLDQDLQDDIFTLLDVIARMRCYPDALGYKPEFQQLLREWRPHLLRDDVA